MRFIGSKVALLGNIENVIKKHTTGEEQIFCDIFSGTSVVARHFKPKYEVHSNDLLHFSYVIQRATIENNQNPRFKKLSNIGIENPIKYLEETHIETYDNDKYFITKNYSPNDNCNRMYISNKNSIRIDFIRNTIEKWKNDGLLDEIEYYYLLASLIEGVPFVSNIAGTYGAYLKQWDKRTFKDFEMMRFQIIDNNKKNKSYNEDANTLIDKLEGDILYLDPPYNSRQYAPNYHLLETISKYDNPQIKGITGMRPYNNEKSSFCIKSEVLEAFEYLLHKARFSNIILSYSSDGLMSVEQIEKVMKKHGIAESYEQYEIPYRKYKSSKIKKENKVSEYLFYIRKPFQRKTLFKFRNESIVKIRPLSTKKYKKSPLNYIGGKYKLLPQILPNFPNDMSIFVDLFSGGCNVAVNINANKIICNDINSKIIEMFKEFQKTSIENVLKQIENRIKEYSLSKTNEQGFLTFREYYNQTQNPIDLYALSCYSFNYQFRFNNSHKYNNPFGKNRSHFSENMRNNLILFVNKLKECDIVFMDNDFEKFNYSLLNSDDLIYCDPPYLITTGTYNDGNRGFKDWGIEEEEKLYSLLDKLNDRNIRFALSNVTHHKNSRNNILIEWSKKYKVIDLSANYSNSSYNTSKGSSREVLVVNYDL